MIFPGKMYEAELEAEVVKLMTDLGLYGFHVRNMIGSEPGWPDWVIIGRRIIYRELKRQADRPTPAQRRVGILIRRAGGDWAVWKPRDLLDGTIRRELEAIS